MSRAMPATPAISVGGVRQGDVICLYCNYCITVGMQTAIRRRFGGWWLVEGLGPSWWRGEGGCGMWGLDTYSTINMSTYCVGRMLL